MYESPLPSAAGIAAVGFGHHTGMLVFLSENLLSAVSRRSPQKFRRCCFPKSLMALNASAWPEPTQSSHTQTHTHTRTHRTTRFVLETEGKSPSLSHSPIHNSTHNHSHYRWFQKVSSHVAGFINKHLCIRANSQRTVKIITELALTSAQGTFMDLSSLVCSNYPRINMGLLNT